MKITSKLSGAFHKAGFQLCKRSPEILMAAGLIGVISSAVLACKATTKLSGIVDESKEKLDEIRDAVNNDELKDKYSADDTKKDTAIIYIQTGVKIIKLYAPALALGALSVTGILGSHNILRKHNIALAAAYTCTSKSFKEYRDRVISRFGEQIDRELKHNIKTVEVEKTVKDNDGKETTVKNTVETIHPNAPCSEYARIFDDKNKNWKKDPEYCRMWLRMQQQYANDLLKANGYIFLNDVYTMLGFKPTKAGQIVGWVYDSKNPVGDNYIDFSIREVYEQCEDEEISDEPTGFLLDFNVDGNILDNFKGGY